MWIGLNIFQINIIIDSSIIKFNVSMRSYLLCTICNIVVFFLNWNLTRLIHFTWDPMHRKYFDDINAQIRFELNTWKIINYNTANWIQRNSLQFTSLIRNKYINFELVQQQQQMNFSSAQASIDAQKLQTIVSMSGIPFQSNEPPH